MSEDVTIVGVDASVPAWAREETLRDLLDTIKKNYSNSGKVSSKLQASLDEMLKAAKDQSDHDEKSSSDLQKALDDLGKELKAERAKNQNKDKKAPKAEPKGGKGKSDKKKSVVEDPASIGAFVKGLGKATEGILKFTAGLATVAIGGGIWEMFKKAAENQWTMSAKLYKSGYNFGVALDKATGQLNSENLASIGYAINKLEVNSENLSEIIKDNGLAIQKFGIRGFADLARSMKSAGNTLGMSLKETSEYLSDYLETQRLSGTFEAIRDRANAANQEKALKDTQAFATALRMSTEDLQAQLKKNLQDVDFRSALQSLPEKSRDAFNMIYTSLEGVAPTIQKLTKLGIKDMAAMHSTDEYRSMLASNASAAAALDKFVNSASSGTLTMDNAAKQLEGIAGTVNTTQSAFNRMNVLAARGLTPNSGAEELAVWARDVRDKISDGVGVLGKNVENDQAKINSRLEDLKNSALAKLDQFVSGLYEGITSTKNFTKALDNAWNALDTIGGKIHDFGAKLGPDLFDALQKGADYFNELFKRMPDGTVNLDFNKIMGDMLTSGTAGWLAAIAGVWVAFKVTTLKTLSDWAKAAEGGFMARTGSVLKGFATRLVTFAAATEMLTNGVGRMSQSFSKNGDGIEHTLNFFSGAAEGVIDPIFKGLTNAANMVGLVGDQQATDFKKYLDDTNLSQFLGMESTDNLLPKYDSSPTPLTKSAPATTNTPTTNIVQAPTDQTVAKSADQTPPAPNPTSAIQPIDLTALSNPDLLNKQGLEKLIQIQEDQLVLLQNLLDMQRRAQATGGQTGFAR